MIPALVEAAKNTKSAVFDYILIPISHHLLAIHCLEITEKKFKNKVLMLFSKLINTHNENTLSLCKSMFIYNAHFLIDKPKSLYLSSPKKLRISLSTGY